jgi:3-hydroxyacyl-[acyl-carrier-protein] dehydratase
MVDVKALLPHREPFLFVDRIEKADGKEIVAYHRFREEEWFFRGHFPGFPVVPGVILLETMAQCGGAGQRQYDGKQATVFYLATVDNVRFRRQVRPGEEVRVVVTNLRVSDAMIRQSGKAFVGEELAAEAQWLCLRGPAQA